MAKLIRDLIVAPGIRVGMATRNVCHEPDSTLVRLFARHDIDIVRLDFMHYLPLHEVKTFYFKAAREWLDINPARDFACGDEHRPTLLTWLPVCTHLSSHMASRVTHA